MKESWPRIGHVHRLPPPILSPALRPTSTTRIGRFINMGVSVLPWTRRSGGESEQGRGDWGQDKNRNQKRVHPCFVPSRHRSAKEAGKTGKKLCAVRSLVLGNARPYKGILPCYRPIT